MPLFQYTAIDNGGQRVEGMLQGGTWKDVESLLSQRGMRLTGIAELSAASAPAVPVKPAAPVAAPSQARVASFPDPVVHTKPVSQTQTPATIVRTRRGSDKDRFFLFNQIGSYLKSGINPAAAFGNLANSWAKERWRGCLLEASEAASQGRRVSDVLARYPDLVPAHAVGLYAVGEAGGFLPDACFQIAAQAEASHKFRRMYVWLNWVWWTSIASFPVCIWGVKGLLAGWDQIEKNGGEGDSKAQIMTGFGQTFMSVLLPSVILGVIFLGIALLWRSRYFERLRHRLTLMVPMSGRRARHESTALFAWAMSNMFRGGASPKAAVESSAWCMPNVELREQMLEKAREMKAESKLSDSIMQVSMLTPEMRAIVQTGEFVGDLSGALANIASVEEAEFAVRDKMSKAQVMSWMSLLMVLSFCLTYIIMQKLWFEGLFQRFDSWTQ